VKAALRPAWSSRDLRVLVLGDGVSVFGSMVSRLALPWTAARELDQGTLSVGLVFVIELMPSALLGLFAGALVDRWSRKRVMIGCNVVLALATAIVPIMAAADRLSMAWIYVAGLISGCVAPFLRAAFRSTVPITVPRECYPAAQSIVHGVSAAGELGAFAAAGWLVAWFGGPAGLAIDAGTFVWAAVVTMWLRPTPPALRRDQRTDVFSELGDGARFVFDDATLAPVAWAELVAGLGTGIIGSVVIVHVTKTLGYATGPQGVVYAVGSIGSLIAAALAPRVLERIGLRRSMALALVAVVPSTALMAFAPHPSVLGYAMLVGQQLLADPLGTIGLVAFGTAIAAAAAETMRGRVESTIGVLATIGTGVGFVVGGVLGQSPLGTAGALMIGACASGAAALCLTQGELARIQATASTGETRRSSISSSNDRSVESSLDGLMP
jgi:Na+/melibiose symporter-like transporter